MYETRISTGAIAALLFAFASTPVLADTAFCIGYAQTWSSAGRCDKCRLTISPKAEQRYEVVANNGWKAEVRRRENEKGATSGEGRWSASSGRTFAGRSFKIALARAGNDLKMAMLVRLDGKQRIVVARFRCLDKDYASSVPVLR
jgi:hypothetical protein